MRRLREGALTPEGTPSTPPARQRLAGLMDQYRSEQVQLVATALRNLSVAVITGHDLDTAQDDAERVLEVVVAHEGDIRPPAGSELIRWRSP